MSECALIQMSGQPAAPVFPAPGECLLAYGSRARATVCCAAGSRVLARSRPGCGQTRVMTEGGSTRAEVAYYYPAPYWHCDEVHQVKAAARRARQVLLHA